LQQQDVLRVQGVNHLGFGIIPKAVMTDRTLSIGAKALYAYIRSFSGAGDVAWPGRDKIMADLGIKTTDTYYKYMNQLKANDLIRVSQERSMDNDGRYKFGRNIFTIVDKPEPSNPEPDNNDSPSGKASNSPCPKKSDTENHRVLKKRHTEKNGTRKTSDTNNNSILKNNSNNKNNNNHSVKKNTGEKRSKQPGTVVVEKHKSINYLEIIEKVKAVTGGPTISEAFAKKIAKDYSEEHLDNALAEMARQIKNGSLKKFKNGVGAWLNAALQRGYQPEYDTQVTFKPRTRQDHVIYKGRTYTIHEFVGAYNQGEIPEEDFNAVAAENEKVFYANLY